MSIELKGAPVAAAINERTGTALGGLLEKGVQPTLAIVRAGERADDLAYENSAARRCEKLGAAVRRVTLPEDAAQARLMENIYALNADAAVHGVLVLLPLPKPLDGEAVRLALSPDKDVDGITDCSLAGVFSGSGRGFAPCTAQACIEILDYYGVGCAGKRAVVIGRSLVVGKPAALLLLARNATVTVCHTKTADLPSVARGAEILIAAAGKPGAVGADCLSAQQVVIDVGVNFAGGKMCGDVDFAAAAPVVSAITPVPGGVGAVTSAVLAAHVVEAAARSLRG
ncbi:MAG: bifunctional 5,10-methylene-tetrahydrofolate dehydrogenase/5,10-methylene-tetrahydrofolate cyclohydrolase [Oscillospiraceae bacterium]|jgi:methylenetetrahydrofolate dehydrogenase (NADP+)/methenyltetrahydrofolate cyclohydrolase|nr:bifunctional 5,10-methylene-tetrahydrofolate dehydrogenase/5,10-methylene-tetrahydrofolate cyclohydrolase [Oscillospiraceae bacterium]